MAWYNGWGRRFLAASLGLLAAAGLYGALWTTTLYSLEVLVEGWQRAPRQPDDGPGPGVFRGALYGPKGRKDAQGEPAALVHRHELSPLRRSPGASGLGSRSTVADQWELDGLRLKTDQGKLPVRFGPPAFVMPDPRDEAYFERFQRAFGPHLPGHVSFSAAHSGPAAPGGLSTVSSIPQGAQVEISACLEKDGTLSTCGDGFDLIVPGRVADAQRPYLWMSRALRAGFGALLGLVVFVVAGGLSRRPAAQPKPPKKPKRAP